MSVLEILCYGALALMGVLSTIALVPALRRPLVTAHVLRWIRPQLPKISDTEQAALDAGTVAWDGQLFTGRPDFTRLLAWRPKPLSTTEREFLDESAEALCRQTDEWAIIHEHHDLPPELWKALKKAGTFGLTIPPAHGGLGVSARAFSDIVQKLGSRSVALAVSAIIPNSLGPGELLHRYGTAEQKHRWLPKLATGEEVPCFALTEPTAGSDAAGMTARGVVVKGRGGEPELSLTWDKRYTTLSTIATVLGLAFKLKDPGKLLGGAEDLGITVALVPADRPGITIGQRHDPLGVPFLNGAHQGRDVRVPLDAIIGGREGVGRGWRMLMECLASGRGIGLPAKCTGLAKVAARVGGAYARVRRQFGLAIGRFEGIEEPLARIAGLTYLMDATRQLTAAMVDAGERPAVLTAITKYWCTELARTVVNDAMDVLGGAAISRGPRNVLAQAYQAIPIAITVEGANILTRTLIVFGQGAVRGHPYVLREQKAALDPDPVRGLREFDRALAGHVWFSTRAAVRAAWHGVTRGFFVGPPVIGPTADEYRSLARLTSAFAFLADSALLTLRGTLKRREKISGRFADALGNLYLASAALWRFEVDGRPAEDLPLVRWSTRLALHRAGQALDGVLRNLPNRLVAFALRRVAFPTGVGAPLPDDRLGAAVARTILEPGPARDRLTAGIFVPEEADGAITRMDLALVAVAAAEPVEAVLRDAVKAKLLPPDARGPAMVAAAVAAGIITKVQADALAAAEVARADAILVDAFPHSEFRGVKAPKPLPPPASPPSAEAKTAKSGRTVRKTRSVKPK